MTNFIPTKGFDNCPKCGGWQVLDYTKRNKAMVPLGALDYRDCDRCLGKGEIPNGKLPVVATEPPKRERQPKVDVTNLPINDIDDIKPVDIWPKAAIGWSSYK